MTKTKYTIKKTILSILALVLTFVALGTTTFAWFSLSTVAKVSNITGDVTAGDGLEVRLVAIDAAGDVIPNSETPWLANLSDTIVGDFISNKVINPLFFFTAVSTNDHDDFLFKKMAPKDNGSGLVINGMDAVRNTDYLEFRIEFRSQSVGTVQLKDYDIEGTLGEMKAPVAYTGSNGSIAKDDNVKVDSSNAVRFSLNEFVYQKAAGGDTNNVANNQPQLGGQLSYLLEIGEELYLNESSNQIKADNIATTVGVDIFLEAATDLSAPAQVTLADDNGTITGFFVVRIWLEGWDADTYDVIYNTKVILSLEFEKIS